MHAATHAERRTQSGRVSRGGQSRSTESRVPAADQTARRGLVFLGTSPRSSFLRALSSFSGGTCRGNVSASIFSLAVAAVVVVTSNKVSN